MFFGDCALNIDFLLRRCVSKDLVYNEWPVKCVLTHLSLIRRELRFTANSKNLNISRFSNVYKAIFEVTLFKI